MDKQIINLGSNPNDGTGDTLRTGGGKVNNNFDTLFLTNVVHVNSASDFPEAVSGVRELVPSSGAKITYLICADIIDMGSDRFTVTDGECVILGAHRTASRIESSTTGTLFTCVDASFFPEKVGVDAPAAKIIDFSTPTGTGSLTLDNMIIWDCDTIADINGAFTTSLRTITVINATTRGVLWTGVDNTQINMTNCLALFWDGVLFDLGTATFGIISIVGGNRFLSPSGTTILSGAASSANLTAGGKAIVEGNVFNGTGTALSGVDVNDLQWEFRSNSFADNTKNTEIIADGYLSASRTVTVADPNTFYTIGGADWLTDLSNRFTVGTDGIVTYNGLEPIDISVLATLTVDKLGGGSDNLCSKIAINGVVQDKTIACTNNGSPTVIQSNGLLSIVSGDTIQIMVENQGSTDNIVVDYANIMIIKR
jgi:hypothetical protein